MARERVRDGVVVGIAAERTRGVHPRLTVAGCVDAVRVLAGLISRCAALRADGATGDGAAWVDAARALGGAPDADAVARALELHSARVAS